MESIVFFGSGPVGLASLKSLSTMFNIEAVVTKPDPKSSRAPRLVADWARQNDLPLLQPNSKEEVIDTVKEAEFSSRMGIVVDYGLIIPKAAYSTFELGIINSHFSLLPEWRGADPITFSLLSMQKKTGVSIMKIDDGLDTGQLLGVVEYKIADDENINTLTDNLVDLSNKTMQEILPKYMNGDVVLVGQDPNVEPTYSRKLDKADGLINWEKPASQIEAEVRAYLGWPGSYTNLNGLEIIITKAAITEDSGKPGSYMASKDELIIHAAEGSIKVLSLKPKGKKEMPVKAFLAGYKSRL